MVFSCSNFPCRGFPGGLAPYRRRRLLAALVDLALVPACHAPMWEFAGVPGAICELSQPSHVLERRAVGSRRCHLAPICGKRDRSRFCEGHNFRGRLGGGQARRSYLAGVRVAIVRAWSEVAFLVGQAQFAVLALLHCFRRSPAIHSTNVVTTALAICQRLSGDCAWQLARRRGARCSKASPRILSITQS